MSAFLLVLDPDPQRRADFLTRARSAFAPTFPGRQDGEVPCIDGVLLYATSPHGAPAYAGGDGVALILGEAQRVEDGASLDAADLHALWTGAPEGPRASLDGYHTLLTVDREGEVRLGADRMGLFPLYTFSSGGVFLAASTPEAFRHHPVFRPQLDLVGLAGLLLTNGLVGEHTLWDGVRRVPTGSVVVRPRGGPARTEEEETLPFSRDHFATSQAERVDAADAVMEDVFARHAGGDAPLAIHLSGGLDSRLAAAYLRHRSPLPEALTFGRDRDLDVRYARAVARAVGFPHRLLDDDEDAVPDAARRMARWEHLAGGFTLLSRWARSRYVDVRPSRVHIGLVLDAIVGPYGWLNTAREDLSPFDQVLQVLTDWGMTPVTLTRLLRPRDGDEAVREALALLRRAYDAVPLDEPYHRAHALYLLHRQRFHVGAVAWPTCFAQTPVLPVLDQRLLGCFLGMPEQALMARRIELALLRRRGPDLARIPLAGNAKEAWAPDPGLAEQLVRRVRMLRHLRRRWLGRRGHLQRFARITSWEGAGWSAVRCDAEAGREAWHEVFDRDRLRVLLPPPDAHLPPERTLAAGAHRRSLLGLFLWGQGASLASQ